MNLGPFHFNPAAFWLLPPVVILLILFRLFRGRRQEITTGSLLLWRRLAASQPKVPPRRIILDVSLLLQSLALAALITALAAPSMAFGNSHGRAVLIVVDNCALARAKLSNGELLWERLRASVAEAIKAQASNDTVILACSSPLPKVLSQSSPSAAQDALSNLTPALSTPETETVQGFAVDQARTRGDKNPLQTTIFSLRNKSSGDAGISNLGASNWRCVAPGSAKLSNTAIVGFGSLPMLNGETPEVQVLVRLKNFDATPVEGSLQLVNDSKTSDRKVSLDANDEKAVVFSIPTTELHPIRIEWKRKENGADSLADDDTIFAAPRPPARFSVRFHSAVPALENLYKKALDATLLTPESNEKCDLEIYSGSVPERIPDNSQAFMLLSPETGFRSWFEIGSDTLKWPKVQRAEDDPLTVGIDDKPEGIFPISKAVEIRQTGNVRTLLKDATSGRSLAAAFADEKARPAFLLAFTPGAGFPAEKPLEPELAAMLVRMALKAANSGEPYVVEHIEEIERRQSAPMPQHWQSNLSQYSQKGIGMLDEKSSELALGRPSGSNETMSGQNASGPEERYDLTWLLITATLLLSGIEFLLEVRS